jgi:hypothetical protein
MVRLQLGRVNQTCSPILIAEVYPIGEVSCPPTPIHLFFLQGREEAILQIAMDI